MHGEPGAPVPPAVHSPFFVMQFTWQVWVDVHAGAGVTGSQPGKASPPASAPPSTVSQVRPGARSTATDAMSPCRIETDRSPRNPMRQPNASFTATERSTGPVRPPVKLTERSVVLTPLMVRGWVGYV